MTMGIEDPVFGLTRLLVTAPDGRFRTRPVHVLVEREGHIRPELWKPEGRHVNLVDPSQVLNPSGRSMLSFVSEAEPAGSPKALETLGLVATSTGAVLELGFAQQHF